MCFTRVRPAATSLAAGGILVTGVAAMAFGATATPAMAAVSAAASITGQQCKAVSVPVSSSSPTPPAVSSPTPSQTPTSTPSTPSDSGTSTPTPTPTPTASSSASASPSASASSTSGTDATATPTATLSARTVLTAATTTPSLCVSVTRSEASIARGQTAYYVVDVWADSGSVGDVAVKLSASPTSQTPTYYLGCGSDDGTAACHLGTVSSGSTTRQVEAEIAVASGATSVSSITLTAKATGTDVNTDPAAAAQVSVTAASSSSQSSSSDDTSSALGDNGTLPLGDTSYPSLNGDGSSYLSNGGSASGLFPTINPSSQPSPGSGSSGQAPARQVAEPEADTTTLPLGTPMVAAQAAGLIALLLACVLAVTRLSVRRRPAPKPPSSSDSDS